ncbi:MAG: bifunctional molybdenum cofactor biosynthesis protein MoaC/MoaB [Cytophagaceae bacterium]|jgi:molybdenum cofactor biosynthesis protein MoaC|nr:bifunctional molybdenum cofactor biosynthesis protein MoaC/MoaB [Cytophagaceae bacterium]
MKDISHKRSSLRTALAEAYISFSHDTYILIRESRIDKGNIFEFARAASFMAAKNTAGILPHCHPVAIEGFETTFELLEEWNGQPAIRIVSEGKCVGRTGIEMEALTAASVAALTMYDMLKPHDTSLLIGGIRLLEKKGGKSERKYFNTPPSCAILYCSRSAAEGKRDDAAARSVQQALQEAGIISIAYEQVPDEPVRIKEKILHWVTEKMAFIWVVGGTGLGKSDFASDTVKTLLEREASGIVEAMRQYGLQRSQLAMMSRLVAGSIQDTMLITVPGSTQGAADAMHALLPGVFHAHKMLKGGDKNG